MTRPHPRLLIIGPQRWHGAVGEVLPACERVVAEHALAGIWQAGHEAFDGVLLALSAADSALRAVRRLRQVAPQARIVVSCSPVDEPGAQRAVQQGADDYVIEPLTREDLSRALLLPETSSAARLGNVPDAEPSPQEKAQFAEVLKNLSEGPQAALDRLADLLREAFAASYAVIQIDEFVAGSGQPTPPALQQTIRRQDASVGTVTLGQPTHGSYGGTAHARLQDYARLIEAIVTVARDRAHWQDLAWSDDLSRLRNRRYFERRLDELISECNRRRAHLTVLLLDIDEFKHYNDRYGHETGDALIREVAYLLTRCSRETDVVARYGGDEFAVIFWDAERARVPGSKHPSDPLVFAERYRQTVRTHQFRCLGPDSPGPVTVSGGLASYPWDGATPAQLLRAADEALLAAKRTGKNRIELAQPRTPGSSPCG